MSDIERIKAYHAIESFVDNETKNLLINQLGLENSNLEKRLPGLTIEDEFALLLHFSDQLKHIISIDETTSFLTNNSIQSDFILHFKDNKKILVEVKSKPERKIKIPKNRCIKQEEFANELGCKLYFAIKLSGFWTLFDSDYLRNNEYKIDLDKDMNNSLLYYILKSQIYAIPQGVKIERIYSKSGNQCLPLNHFEYGMLESFKVFYQNKLLFDVSIDNMEHFYTCLVLEYWYEQLIENLEIEKIDSNKTKLIDNVNSELLSLDFKYFISFIHHTIHENNIRYDSASFLKLIASKQDVSLTKKRLEAILNNLKKLGIPISSGEFLKPDEIMFKS